jgi:hypothetical protein
VSNLGSLPQFPVGTTISLVAGASWLDQFYVQSPGYSATPVSVLGNLTSGNATIPLNSVNGITNGCLIEGYGIVPGSQVVAVVGSPTNTVTINNAALVSATNVPLLVYGPALDLTGITFQSTVRESLTSFSMLLLATTANGWMINGGVTGTFGWNVPAGAANWPLGLTQVGGLGAVVDVQASDQSGAIVDLCTLAGPMPLTVTLGPPPVQPISFSMVRINSQ